ncbi:hypothetical protein PspLS_01332 [Pyricularia sp. CBS 133598]|nr:hypothetical protein PspLS_01332 [Pyricularia sp. CBS 133598]
MPSRIIVIGSGFAGLYSALSARRLISIHRKENPDVEDVEVCVIAPEPSLVITPRLYLANPERMTASLEDLFKATGIRFIRGYADKILPEDKHVLVAATDGTNSSEGYDRLIVAAGSQLAHPDIPGLKEHSFAVHNLDKATELENHLRGLPFLPESEARNTVVVCGAGFTGIETAAELPARLRNILGQDTSIRVVIVDRNDEVGPELGPGPRPFIKEALQTLGVETRLGSGAVGVEADGVILESGEKIQAATVVWTAGVRASPLTDQVQTKKDGLGRLTVDKNLQVVDMPGVYAAGDAADAKADAEGHSAMMSCQHAMPLGRVAGNNAAASLLGLDPTPYSQPLYATCLALGSYGALISWGWDRQVMFAGPKAKPLKQYINRVLIYPPGANEVEAFAAADPALALSAFFSLHRPMSITHSLPRTVTDDAFASIFLRRGRTEKTQDVISTLSNTVHELEKPMGNLGLSHGDADANEGVREITLKNADGSDSGVCVQLNDMLGSKFQPFCPPPLPKPAATEGSSTAAEAAEASENSQVEPQRRLYKAVLTIEETVDENGEVKYVAHSSDLLEDSAQPRSFLERMAARQLRFEDSQRQRQQDGMWAISVKRQRKLKMKKKNISTSTGSPSVYSAMSGGSNGQGAFPLCKAVAEAKTPLCLPKDGSILNPGITYYVTWDPTFLKNATNTTVTITTTYYNMTTAMLMNETITPSSTDEHAIPFWRGFYAWPVGWQILQPGRPEMNVTLTLTTTTRHLNTTTVAEHRGPVVLVEKEKSFRQPDTPTPAGPEIYIGLPVILGFVLLMVFGTCVWNRNARRIDLGALVARSRRGRSERGRGRYQRLGGDDNDNDDGNFGASGGRSGRRQRKESIRLTEYDEGEEMESGRFGRRDSVDSLGSLAESPVRHTRKRHGD